MKKKNPEIYERTKTLNVFHWQVAEKLGVSDSTHYRNMRRELPDKEKVKILKIIEEIAEQQKKEADLGDD